MARQYFTISPEFARVKIETVDHATLQRGNDSKIASRFGLHSPSWRIKTLTPEWEIKSRNAAPSALLGVELVFEYSGLVQISKKIDAKSKCYKLAEEHELEHETICVDETKAAKSTCEKILQSHVEAILKRDYKNDLAKAYADEKAFGKKVGIAAFTEMQDGPFYKVADKSAKIDTPSTYAPIDAACQEYAD